MVRANKGSLLLYFLYNSCLLQSKQECNETTINTLGVPLSLLFKSYSRVHFDNVDIPIFATFPIYFVLYFSFLLLIMMFTSSSLELMLELPKNYPK